MEATDTNIVEEVMKEAITPSHEKVLESYKHLQITNNTDIPEPIPVITINDETVATYGSIICVSGPSKSGKSAAIGVIVAGAIAPGDYDGFPPIYIKPANGKAVIHFDTEQSRHTHKKNLCSTLRRAGLDDCPDNLLSYNIRELELNEYRGVTDDIIAAAHAKFNGVHLVVIDGIGDYIRDPNEPKESNEIVKYFEELAIKYSCPIIAIIHTNPNSDKERGHLGSQLQRKSESVLTVKTEGDISRLEPKFLRMAGKGNIPHIQFMYDKTKGYHVYCGIRPLEEQSAKDEKRIADIQEIADKVFLPTSAFSYGDAIDAIMNYTKKKDVTAKGYFKEMKAHRMIVQDNENKWRNANPL